MNTARRPFVALAVACSLAVAGCGGPSVQELTNETFTGDKKVDSGKLTLDLGVSAQGSPQLSQPLQLKVGGPFQTQGERKLPKFDMTITFGGAGQSFNAGLVSTGTAGFVKAQGSAYELPAQVFTQIQQAYSQAQTRSASQGENQSLSALGIDPRHWLRTPEIKGDEDVAGTKTTHVSASVDIPKLIQDVNKSLQQARAKGLPNAGQLPPSITPEQQRQVQEAIKSVTFDFWTGKDDKILRRLAVRLSFQVPEAERAQAGGITSGQVTFNMQLAELNDAQTINAPPNPRPFSELSGALGGAGGLGGLLGGLGGGAGGGGAPGPGASGGGAPPGGGGPNQAYVECLQKAGGDVAKAQECSELLSR